MVTIDEQKQAADIILDKLEIIDPNAILAGGAPRDWHMGKHANDLDFYIHLNPSNQAQKNTRQIETVLSMVGILDLENISEKSMKNSTGSYACMEHLRTVYEGNYFVSDEDNFIKVQVMVMREPTFDCVVDKMGCSLSKIWYKSGHINPSEEFLFALDKKVIYHTDDKTFKSKFASKMRDRFPQYSFRELTHYKYDFKTEALNFYRTQLIKGNTND